MKKLMQKVKENYSKEDFQLVVRTYEYAKAAHEGQKRVSGEDYIIHPLRVAEILVDFGLDAPTICAALLHDVIEDTKITEEEVKRDFGEEITNLVTGVTKLDKLNYNSKEEEQAENLRKMFVAMAKDIRVLLIKLADRLHNMRSLEYLEKSRQIKMAQETLDIIAPLAGRLGISQIKCELEDLCMKYLLPEDYNYLYEHVTLKANERKEFIAKVVGVLDDLLKSSEIEGDVFGRTKHLYSIYKKMKKKNLPLDQIYDITAFRVIVNTIDECYEIFGKVHKMWKPIPGRIKDYIATPKQNMYQSLHTTVMTSFGQIVEIQIRTKEMHMTAEYGIAAHWKYKEGKENKNITNFDQRLTWLREVMEWKGDLKDSSEFLQMIKGDIGYNGELLVFSPQGDVISLPNGSTPIDFAYRIHSAVGNKCVGAKVNNKIVPLTYKLALGDMIEIMTNPNAKGPSWDWLKIVVSSGAKAKIRQFFKQERREDNIKRGKVALEREIKRRNFVVNEIMSDNATKAVMSKFSFNTLDEMYASLGYGAVSVAQVALKYIDIYLKDVQKNKPEEFIKTSSRKHHNDAGVVIKGYSEFLIRMAGCCSPVPGDPIIGFISRGRGVMIHRMDCPNIKGLEKERLIEASWKASTDKTFSVNFQIVSVDEMGLLTKITTLINNMQIPISAMNARVDKQKNAVIDLTVEISNIADLSNLIKKVESYPSVIGVYRKTN